MKRILQILLFLLVFAVAACDKPVVPKPRHLIHQDKMIDMLADIHMAEATYNKYRYDSSQTHFSSVDFYYSVLAKYEVPDSVFEKSFLYYASEPKDFEKMYRKVLSKLSLTEQQLSGRKEQKLQFDDELNITNERK